MQIPSALFGKKHKPKGQPLCEINSVFTLKPVRSDKKFFFSSPTYFLVNRYRAIGIRSKQQPQADNLVQCICIVKKSYMA